ncbi:MAG TPA: Crp/Fnr family transcriptional regulator [Candidatus Eisenbacteria bacterium]|nr:Crp/Fnr family transcriptional regulator [Candidatus Eisenbacteria bacterium]
MKKLCDFLAMTDLFDGLNHSVYRDYCEQTNVNLYWKGEFVAREGDVSLGVGIVLEGQLAKQKYSPDGDSATLDLLEAGDTFGEDLIFSQDNKYTFSLEAVSHVKLVYVKRDDIYEMINRSPQMLSNLLSLLSNHIHTQNKRIYTLSQRTLRQKISAYLLDLLEQQLINDNTTLEEASRIVSTQAVELPASKEVISRLLAMPRPSFSRELISMEKDNLLRVSGRIIWLTDLEGLENGVTRDFAS